jgi:hypothetical protein
MIKQITYIILVILFVSCAGEGKKRVKKPDNLISKDKMVEVIYDMSLISAAKGVNRKLMEQKGVHPEKYIYEKHGIDSVQFALSNEYYAFDLDAYEEIYKEVKLKLAKSKRAYSDLVQVEQRQKDSLIKSNRKNRDSIKRNRELTGERLNVGNEKVKPLNRLKTVDSLKKSKNQ